MIISPTKQPQYVRSRGRCGPSASFSLSERRGDGSTVYQLDIKGVFDDGERHLQTITTAAANAVDGERSRVVAIAYCPGVKRWIVGIRYVSGDRTARADVTIRSLECCAGLPFPVVANAPYATQNGGNNGGSSSAPPTSLSTPTDITTGAVATPIVGAVTPASSVTLRADPTNGADIRIGDSGIGAARGQILQPGDTLTIEINDAQKLFAWSAVAATLQVLIEGATPATVATGIATPADITTGAAAPIVPTSVPSRRVHLRADPGNGLTVIRVGDSGVGPARGQILQAGDSLTIDIADARSVFAFSAAAATLEVLIEEP